ncbi:hypothetical protein [Pseudomonas mandelii]|nr:hypothetical protein [Pseudomonas mandelii]
MGKPIKIDFTYNPVINPTLSLRLFRKPYTPSTGCTRIKALTDTTKGVVQSEFTLISDIEGDVCMLRTNYNHCDSALLDGETVYFYTLLKTRKETRRGGHHLADSLYHFHHWLVSEISEALNIKGYFLSLHGAPEIKSFNLEKLPKIQTKMQKSEIQLS